MLANTKPSKCLANFLSLSSWVNDPTQEQDTLLLNPTHVSAAPTLTKAVMVATFSSSDQTGTKVWEDLTAE